VWFSEPIQPGTGAITVKLDGPAAVNWTYVLNITHPNVTIDVTRLSFHLWKGALNRVGAWLMQLPPGLVIDEDGNKFPGYTNNLGLEKGYFYVQYADTVKPTLGAKKPPPESTLGYGLSPSVTFQLTFNELIQAGSGGGIHFVPKYTSPQVLIPSSSTEVLFSGTYVVIAPNTDLMPGRYTRW
jgi:hypothetical protein